MKAFGITACLILATAVGGLYAWVRLKSEMRDDSANRQVILVEIDEEHRVTPEMLTSTEKMAEQSAPEFHAEASDGQTYALTDLAKDVPVFLVFIKDGCPCSESAQPFYNQLYRAYGARATFLGVIDGDAKVAARWAQANRVPFPILCDPELKIVHDYKVENSAYVAVVSPTRRMIDRMWPGYSKSMLTEVGERLAHLCGVPVKPIDVSASPAEPYSGCPFF